MVIVIIAVISGTVVKARLLRRSKADSFDTRR